MSEKYYTKEGGWTEAGIKEQERRSDLTKLTAEELMRFSPDVDGVMPEIRRRLESADEWKVAADIVGERLIAAEKRLEKCKAAIAKCKLAGECGYDAARAAVEGK